MVMDRCAIFRRTIITTRAAAAAAEEIQGERLNTKTVKVINKNMKDIEQETHFSHSQGKKDSFHMWRIASLFRIKSRLSGGVLIKEVEPNRSRDCRGPGLLAVSFVAFIK